ncbi:hypothetical protein GUITHDRAFT_112426 [Guillardia theta CCMP2712]|uniref:Uncharacterized protein n=1 Tax=Guillardia theta (strain CCMP2712) TaxID=905079 RepID=L1IYV7_GUITC|nr:hypothetical protein GUITHDRAFT_112426 [Guillardia theta CCMP2712]EKX41453.1 hypothetical protein GUITHDRAFT_112426 [Guillardia theta CCMP2712]|eukprot:XP_005828433.1 hypothetical protein GUITHDRAFT_112426 [Guillardia theta CCMP2712]
MQCLVGMYTGNCEWLEELNSLKIPINECAKNSKDGINITIPQEANIVTPSVGIPYDERSITIETNALAGPVLPTPVQVVPPIGSFLDSSSLAFDHNASAAEVSTLLLRFRASMSIFIGEVVTLHLPGFQQERQVPVVFSSVEFSAASWQASSQSLIFTAGENITAGTLCNVTVLRDAMIRLPLDGVRVNQSSLKLSTNARQGPILPTSISLVQPVGHFVQSELLYDPGMAGVPNKITLKLVASMNMSAVKEFRYLAREFVQTLQDFYLEVMQSRDRSIKHLPIPFPWDGQGTNVRFNFIPEMALDINDIITVKLPGFSTNNVQSNFSLISDPIQIFSSASWNSITQELKMTVSAHVDMKTNVSIWTEPTINLTLPNIGVGKHNNGIMLSADAAAGPVYFIRPSYIQYIGSFLDSTALSLSPILANASVVIEISFVPEMNIYPGESIKITLTGFTGKDLATGLPENNILFNVTWTSSENVLEIIPLKLITRGTSELLVIPSSFGIRSPLTGLSGNQTDLKISTNAAEGPVLPTPIRQSPSIGSFGDSTRLDFSPHIPGALAEVYIHFAPTMDIFANGTVVVDLPLFSKQQGSCVVFSCVPDVVSDITFVDSQLRIQTFKQINAQQNVSIVISNRSGFTVPLAGIQRETKIYTISTQASSAPVIATPFYHVRSLPSILYKQAQGFVVAKIDANSVILDANADSTLDIYKACTLIVYFNGTQNAFEARVIQEFQSGRRAIVNGNFSSIKNNKYVIQCPTPKFFFTQPIPGSNIDTLTFEMVSRYPLSSGDKISLQAPDFQFCRFRCCPTSIIPTGILEGQVSNVDIVRGNVTFNYSDPDIVWNGDDSTFLVTMRRDVMPYTLTRVVINTVNANGHAIWPPEVLLPDSNKIGVSISTKDSDMSLVPIIVSQPIGFFASIPKLVFDPQVAGGNTQVTLNYSTIADSTDPITKIKLYLPSFTATSQTFSLPSSTISISQLVGGVSVNIVWNHQATSHVTYTLPSTSGIKLPITGIRSEQNSFQIEVKDGFPTIASTSRIGAFENVMMSLNPPVAGSTVQITVTLQNKMQIMNGESISLRLPRFECSQCDKELPLGGRNRNDFIAQWDSHSSTLIFVVKCKSRFDVGYNFEIILQQSAGLKSPALGISTDYQSNAITISSNATDGPVHDMLVADVTPVGLIEDSTILYSRHLAGAIISLRISFKTMFKLDRGDVIDVFLPKFSVNNPVFADSACFGLGCAFLSFETNWIESQARLSIRILYGSAAVGDLVNIFIPAEIGIRLPLGALSQNDASISLSVSAASGNYAKSPFHYSESVGYVQYSEIDFEPRRAGSLVQVNLLVVPAMNLTSGDQINVQLQNFVRVDPASSSNSASNSYLLSWSSQSQQLTIQLLTSYAAGTNVRFEILSSFGITTPNDGVAPNSIFIQVVSKSGYVDWGNVGQAPAIGSFLFSKILFDPAVAGSASNINIDLQTSMSFRPSDQIVVEMRGFHILNNSDALVQESCFRVVPENLLAVRIISKQNHSNSNDTNQSLINCTCPYVCHEQANGISLSLDLKTELPARTSFKVELRACAGIVISKVGVTDADVVISTNASLGFVLKTHFQQLTTVGAFAESPELMFSISNTTRRTAISVAFSTVMTLYLNDAIVLWLPQFTINRQEATSLQMIVDNETFAVKNYSWLSFTNDPCMGGKLFINVPTTIQSCVGLQVLVPETFGFVLPVWNTSTLSKDFRIQLISDRMPILPTTVSNYSPFQDLFEIFFIDFTGYDPETCGSVRTIEINFKANIDFQDGDNLQLKLPVEYELLPGFQTHPKATSGFNITRSNDVIEIYFTELKPHSTPTSLSINTSNLLRLPTAGQVENASMIGIQASIGKEKMCILQILFTEFVSTTQESDFLTTA